MKQLNTVSNRRQYSSCSLKKKRKWTNAKESKQINEPTPKKANKQTNRQATGMKNADGEEEEMRKVWCCKWAGWCPFYSMKHFELTRDEELRETHRTLWCEVRMHIMIRATYWAAWYEWRIHIMTKSPVQGALGWWAGSWGQLVVMHAKKGRTSTSTMRLHDGKGHTSWTAPLEKSLVDWWSTAILWAPWWEERMRSSWAPFTESLLDGWKCAATAVCSSRQGRTDKDVCGSRD